MRGADRLHVVVDAGIDDAVALGVLTGLGLPMAQVIATEGSVDLVTTAATTARLLATLGNPAPARLGASAGLRAAYPAGRDPFHGTDGFGGQAEQLHRAAVPVNSSGPLEGQVFCSAALTVVAAAIERGDPIDAVTWMGGSVRAGGNMTAVAEFNAWMDPYAADLVFTSEVAVSMVPLDVTMQCAWTAADLALLGARAESLAAPIRGMCERDGSFIPHDAVAAIAMVEPSLFDWIPRYVRCETAGRFTSGQTVVDQRRQAPEPNALVAEAVDAGAVKARIFEVLGRL